MHAGIREVALQGLGRPLHLKLQMLQKDLTEIEGEREGDRERERELPPISLSL